MFCMVSVMSLMDAEHVHPFLRLSVQPNVTKLLSTETPCKDIPDLKADASDASLLLSTLRLPWSWSPMVFLCAPSGQRVGRTVSAKQVSAKQGWCIAAGAPASKVHGCHVAAWQATATCSWRFDGICCFDTSAVDPTYSDS